MAVCAWLRRLYPVVRRGADYDRSLGLLRSAKGISPGLLTKTALMVGLGEGMGEVAGTIADIRKTGCDIYELSKEALINKDIDLEVTKIILSILTIPYTVVAHLKRCATKFESFVRN